MAEDESRLQSTNGRDVESLSDSERAMVSALRAPVPVDADAFDARVMAAVRREPAFGGARHRSHRGLGAAGAAIAGLAALAAMVLFAVDGGRNVAHGVHGASVANAHTALGATGATARAATRTVRFTLVASGASRVVIAGSFNGWNTVATPLRRVGKDTWAADISLGAGRYEYQFVINGNRWVADPRAPRGAGDDFGATNSVVTVPVPGSA